jgi:hypothetical protein
VRTPVELLKKAGQFLRWYDWASVADGEPVRPSVWHWRRTRITPPGGVYLQALVSSSRQTLTNNDMSERKRVGTLVLAVAVSVADSALVLHRLHQLGERSQHVNSIPLSHDHAGL